MKTHQHITAFGTRVETPLIRNGGVPCTVDVLQGLHPMVMRVAVAPTA